MSNFSTQLQITLERLGMSQAQVAKAAEMQPSLFNGYFKGEHRPTGDGLERICRVFDLPERADLVIAHLRDETPTCAADLIRIVSLVNTPRLADQGEETYAKVELPKKLMSDFEFLMRRARTHPEVGEWIKTTVDIFRGR